MEFRQLRNYLATVVVLLFILSGCIAPVAAPVAEAHADAKAPAASESTAEMSAVEVSAPFDLVVAVSDFAPGNWTAFHEHGGPVLITVLSGEITRRDNATSEEITYSPGEAWVEETTDVFAVGNDGEEDARVVAAFLVPEGASLTTTTEGVDTDSPPPGPARVYRNSMLATTPAQ